jgi:hypothetical protein
VKYADDLKVRDARLTYYTDNGIAADGGASERIGRADFGPITLYVPNFLARIAALQRHDLHHIVLDADTSMRGEAIVGGFETATGCGSFWVSWFLAPQTIIYGLFLNPSQTFRSFLLGRRSKSFFHGTFQEEWLDTTVGYLRDQHLAKGEIAPKLGDYLIFLFWILIGAAELSISLFLLSMPSLATSGIHWFLIFGT